MPPTKDKRKSKAAAAASIIADSTSASNSPAPLSNSGVSADVQIKEMLSELHQLIMQIQDERNRGEHNLVNIAKTHERMQLEQKLAVSPYYKTKLKSLYNTAMSDAESEAELLRKALEKIADIKSFRNDRNGDRPKQIMRRGVLMTMLQQNALTLPLWIGKPGEKPPPLCGAVPAETHYIAKQGDKVAARVRSSDGEENWILAEVVSYITASSKYEVDDIDAEEGKERHTLSRRRIVSLPIWKANPETDPEALFPKQTATEDYSVLFEDTSYAEGYSPPLMVPQRYVIICKEDKKK